AWAGFVQTRNRRGDGRVRCLHAEQGDDAQALATELRELAADAALFIVAEDGGRPLGWIGGEVDATAGRVWLRGPLTVDGPDADTLRRALIDELLRSLPAARRFDAFPQSDETPLVMVYGSTGFNAVAAYHVMRAAQAPELPAADGIASLQPGAAVMPQLLALHEQLFPNTYLRGDALPASLDANHLLFAAVQGDQLLGYVYVQHKHAEPEGYVDYLGVAEAARGRGLGRALLATALRWALRERGLPCVHLTVRQQNAEALGLYRSVGFVEVAAGLQLSWQRP
ncbi:MAG: GNAT family N-acetyltransferase, partial [Rubrivivax sp.]